MINFSSDAKKVVSGVLDRIQRLSVLGGSFLNVYALLPYIFHAIDDATLHYMMERAVTQYDTVKTTKNDCALLGVILLVLTGRISADRKVELLNDLRRLMAGIDPAIWFHFPKEFSLEGELLAHEAGMTAYRGTEWEKVFYNFSRRAILQSIETLPVDQGKLPSPGTLA